MADAGDTSGKAGAALAGKKKEAPVASVVGAVKGAVSGGTPGPAATGGKQGGAADWEWLTMSL